MTNVYSDLYDAYTVWIDVRVLTAWQGRTELKQIYI